MADHRLTRTTNAAPCRRRRQFCAGVAGLGTLLGGVPAARALTTSQARVGTASPIRMVRLAVSGSAYGFALAWAAAIDRATGPTPGGPLRLEVLGSVDPGESIEQVRLGRAELAIVDGLQAQGLDEREFRLVATLWDAVAHWLLRSDRVIEGRIDDLAALSPTSMVALGDRSVSPSLLETLGLGLEGRVRTTLQSATGAVQALNDGAVVAWGLSGTPPIPAVSRLFAQFPATARLLRLMPEHAARLGGHDAAWRVARLPGGIYPGVGRDVPTAAYPVVAVATREVSPQTVGRILESLFRHLHALRAIHPGARAITQRTLLRVRPVPVHEGTKRFLDEQGLGRLVPRAGGNPGG